MLRRVMLGLALLALFIGPRAREQDGGRSLKHVRVLAGGAIGASSFVENGSYGRFAPDLPAGIHTRGSWLDSDAFEGSHETGWYRVEGRVQVLISGGPSHAGNRLEADLRAPDGRVTVVRYQGPDPGPAWWRWDLPSDGVQAVRLRAHDGAQDGGGWLAFSEPVSRPRGHPLRLQLFWLLQVACSGCLALVLLYGPGLAYMVLRGNALARLPLSLLLGPALLATLGGACWLLGGVIAPSTVARVGVCLVLAGLAVCLWRGRGAALPPEIASVLFASALLAAFAITKANVSLGPEGELYAGSVSRTLEVGGHSDSRISFHGVQVVAHHYAPFAPSAQAYYAPWSFTSRGPLPSLIAAPVVLALGARVPTGMPDQQWIPFDREGFTSYRIVLIVLASLSLGCLYALMAQRLGPALGLRAVAAAALTPFFVHELYFTWPKLIAAGCVLLAFLYALRGRAGWSGASLALGYLMHPVVLLSAPFLALYFLCAAERGRRLVTPTIFCVVVLAVFGAWQALPLLEPGASSGSQRVFIEYLRHADNQPASWSSSAWWLSRWHNLANTFVPFYMLSVDPGHESINELHGRSSALTHAWFLYWNTLPGALGLVGCVPLALGWWLALQRSVRLVALTFIGPALFLVLYWGAADTGLMRHSGHVLFLAFIALSVWGLAREEPLAQRVRAWFSHPAIFGLRAVEVFLMSCLTTFAAQLPRVSGPFALNDAVSLTLGAVCLALAARCLGSPRLSPQTRPLHSLSGASQQTRLTEVGRADYVQD